MFPDPVNNNPVHLSYERREAVAVRMIADHVEQLENETFINEQDHQWLYVIDLGWR
jgi:ribosomal protein S7